MKKFLSFFPILLISLLIFAISCRKYDDTPIIPESTTSADTTLCETTVEETLEETAPAGTVPGETDAPETVVETEEETTEEETTVEDTGYKALNYEDMKCTWLSQFDLQNVYSYNSKQRSEDEFTELLTVVLDNVKSLGCNTVIVQMRPNADSIYPSDVYPPSLYAVGDYGKEFSYDPIEILVGMAHERELSVHAWINPLRATSDANIKKIGTDYTVGEWYADSELNGKYLVYSGSFWYLNPAYDEVRQLIIDGAAEILEKYEVDGLHMDDYFYPTTDAGFDSAAYAEYKTAGGTLGLMDFRRDSLNQLISGLYETVKKSGKARLFGISPAGNWNTVYDAHCADYKSWCSRPGYIDYICPQIYFGMEHASYDFVKTAEKWQSFITDESGVKLIIGMSLGKAKSGVDNYAGSGKNEWSEHKDILKRCLEYTENLDRCVGVCYFCYQYFYDPVSGAEIPETKQERDNFLPILKDISWQ